MIATDEILTGPRIRLMLDHPYLASAILRFPLHRCSDPTVCPVMATDGYHVMYNPEGLSRYDEAGRMFILAHEVVHCLFSHVERRQGRDPHVWNLAIDYATNLLLADFGLEPTADCLLYVGYRGHTAEEIYDRLTEEGAKSPNRTRESVSFDLHMAPGSMDRMLDSLGADDAESPSAQQRGRLRRSLCDEFSKALRRCRGTISHFLEQEIGIAGGGRVPWESLLARFFSGLRRDDYRLFPASRKHIWRGLYLPSIGRPGPSHVIVAIDTSGSMGRDELGRVLGEIDKLRSVSQCRLTIVQCDTQVQKVEEFDEHTPADFRRHRMHGRGGTAFTPVFEWLDEQSRNPGFRPDVLFYMTDGYGNFPERPPSIPVAWILTGPYTEQIPFGQKISLV